MSEKVNEKASKSPRDVLVEHLKEAMEPGYSRLHSDRHLQGLMGLIFNAKLPAPIRDSLLIMTHFEYGRVGEGAMAVQLKGNSIRLIVDLDYMDALVRMKDVIGERQLHDEICNLLHHELAHLLLGHLDGPAAEFTDPIMILAKEIAVNDGWLRLKETLYPFVRLESLPYANRVYEYAKEHRFPKDWLQQHYLVYQALGSVAPKAFLISRGKLQELIDDYKPDNVNDYAPGGDDQMVLVVIYENDDGHREATVYPVVMNSPADSSSVKDIHEAVRYELLNSGDYQYDQASGSYRYSPNGFAEHERVIKMKSYRVPWHLIRRIFGVKRILGYDRRRGHLYPPDEAPLVTRSFERKRIYVFYDSSGSIPDEVLGKFIGTVKLSPLRVVEKYFSTQISDTPHTGGTDFKCIEEYLLGLDNYPDTVVVLTDGHASANFEPKYPERWYWIVHGSTEVPLKIGGTVIEVQEQESFL